MERGTRRGGRATTYTESLAGEARTTTRTYDLAGRVTGETLTAGIGGSGNAATSYAYDDAGQLVTSTRSTAAGVSTTAYVYDAVGNRRSVATSGGVVERYQYDDANQLTIAARDVNGATTDTVTFTHDASGRMIRVVDVAGRSRSLDYDRKGVLERVTATDAAGAPAGTVERRTDGFGELTRHIATDAFGAGTTTRFAWYTSSLVRQIATVTAAGTASATNYLYGHSRLAAIRNGQADHFAADMHASTEARGEAADLAHAPAYDANGQPVAAPSANLQPLVDDLAPGNNLQPEFGYRGELTTTGLTHLRNRDYNPAIARFTTVDPLEGVPGDVAVANPYVYAANDPLNKQDPLGLSWRNPCIGSACMLDTGGALVDTLSKVPTPGEFWQHQQQVGAAAVDRYIAQTGEVPTGLDLVNVSINPGYKTLDRCSAYACGSGAALDCALSIADLVGTAFAIEQVGVSVTRVVAGRVIVSETGSIGGSAGSTGRTAANNLTEQLAMEQAVSNPTAGVRLRLVMSDPRWPASSGWVKMSQKIGGVEIHYVRNTVTGAVDDFKFVG